MTNPFSKNIVFALYIIVLFGCHPERNKWRYTPFSKAVIQYNIINDPPGPYFVNTENNTLVPGDYYNSKPIKIEQSGKYNFTIETDRPSIVKTNFGEESFNIFVFPKDTSRINVEFVDGGYEITFSGNTKAINTYYFEKKLEFKILDSYWRYSFHVIAASELTKVKHKIDSFTKVQLSFLNNYKPIKKISSKFINFERSEIIYNGINNKLNSVYTRFKLDRTDHYYDFLKSVEIDNHGAIFSQSYLRFLDSYFEFTEMIDSNDSLSRDQAVQNTALRRIVTSNKLLSGYNRKIYNLYNFCRIIGYHQDKNYIDSLADSYQIKDYESLLNLLGSRDKKGHKIEDIEPGIQIPDFYTTDKNYALVSIRDFEDNILLIRFYIQQSESLKIRSLVLSGLENMYRENNNIQFLNICIDCESQTWLDSASNYSSNIINLMAEGNWNNALKRTYQITWSQKYVMLNQDNQYIEMFKTIPVNIQDKIDSLLKNSKYLEIQIQ